jgi:outer membrane receptor protein involved in Fe transport
MMDLFRIIREIRGVLNFFPMLLAALAFAADTGTIRGTVTDSAGAVVAGAVIEARNIETGVQYKAESSETGDFNLAEMPAGDYELRVSMRGFKQYVHTGIKVAVSQILRMDIRLEVGHIRETVTVNADAPLTKMDNPQLEPAALQISVSAIERAQIERQGAKTIMDALDFVPGGWTETRGRKEKQLFSVRGQRYPYPEYSIDGALFREFYEMPYFLSAEDVERVEVLRSSAALLTGISGLAGVVNIVPREYEQSETRWLAEYGSLGSYRVHVSHGQKIGALSYGLGMGGSSTDGPEGRHGSEKMLDLFANANWNHGNSLSVRATTFYAQGERELVQAEPPAAEQYRTALQRYDPVQEVAGSVKVLYRPAHWASTEFSVGYSNRRNMFVAVTDSISQDTRDYDHEWNLNLIQSLALSKRNVLRVGANYNHWVAPYGIRFYSGRRSDLETYSLAIVDEHSIGRLLLDGGLRYQRTYINEYGAFNIDGTSTAFKKVPSVMNQWEPAQPSGSLGATYFLTERFSLRANFLTGAIEPRRGTLTVNLTEPSTERRTMVDAGFRMARDRFGEISLTGFVIRQKDAIVLSGSTKTVNGRIMELYENRDQDSKGVEFEFRSRPLFGNINFFFNVTGMNPRARIDGSMSRDPEIPPAIIGAGLMGKKRGFDYNVFWKYISGYESSRFTDPPALQPLGGFHTVNLTIGRTLDSSEKIRVYLEMTNIGDSRYSTVIGYPDYGRRLNLGIRQVF